MKALSKLHEEEKLDSEMVGLDVHFNFTKESYDLLLDLAVKNGVSLESFLANGIEDAVQTLKRG